MISKNEFPNVRYFVCFFIILVCFYQSAKSQSRNGAFLTECNFSLLHSEATEKIHDFDSFSKTNYFSISAGFGRFINERWLMGFGTMYRHYDRYSDTYYQGIRDDYESIKSNGFSFYPYISRYIRMSDKVFISITSALSFGVEKGDYIADFAATYKLKYYSSYIYPGVTWFLSKRWALNASFGKLFYDFKTTTMQDPSADSNDISKESNFGLDFQMNTSNIGVKYLFRIKDN